MKEMKKALLKKVKELDHLIIKAEKSLKKAPEGALVLSKSNGTVQYYHKTERKQKKGKYISAKDRKLVESLAQKDYDLRFLKAMNEQKKKIMRAIKLLPDIEPVQIYSGLSEARKALVRPHTMTDEQYVEHWMNVQYEGKPFLEEAPSIMTERGERVRSKSEKILADKFFSMGIPYRYEYPLKLKGYGTVYPDFTLLNVRTREEVYLEHFGMMDNPEYAQKAIQKIYNYAKNEIYIGKKLLGTFETLQNQLDMKVAEQMLKEFTL